MVESSIYSLRQTFNYNDPVREGYHSNMYTGHFRVGEQFGANLREKLKIKRNCKLRIVDLGCSRGFTTVEIAARFGSNTRVFGLDQYFRVVKFINAPKIVEYYNKAITDDSFNHLMPVSLSQIHFLEGDAYYPPFAEESMDIAFAMNNIYQVARKGELTVEQQALIFRNVMKIVRPNGFFCYSGVFGEDFYGGDLFQTFIFRKGASSISRITLIDCANNFPQDSLVFSDRETSRMKEMTLRAMGISENMTTSKEN